MVIYTVALRFKTLGTIPSINPVQFFSADPPLIINEPSLSVSTNVSPTASGASTPGGFGGSQVSHASYVDRRGRTVLKPVRELPVWIRKPDRNQIKSYWDFFQTEIDLKCCCLVSSLKSNYFLKSFLKHEPRLSKSWTLQSSVDSNCQSPCCHLGIQGHGAKPLAAPTFQSIHFHF